MVSAMRAWQYHTIHGILEKSLNLNSSLPIPQKSSLQVGQLLIKVISAALNPVDYKLPEASFIGRLAISRPATPGGDFCGRVIAKHESNTSSFKDGQLVFGAFDKQSNCGTLSEYVVVNSSECAVLPPEVEPNQGGAVGIAATTALQSLGSGGTLTSTFIKPGSNVLINGGSGGVGTYTIQFARLMGARVTTTCSTTNVALCQQLGANEVIDYKKTPVVPALESKGKVFDLVVDNVGADPDLYNKSAAFLKPGAPFMQVGVGHAVSICGMGQIYARMLFTGGNRYQLVKQKSSTTFYETIGEWMAEGKVRPVIDEVFEFDQVPKAFEKLRAGHAKGKIVIRVSMQ